MFVTEKERLLILIFFFAYDMFNLVSSVAYGMLFMLRFHFKFLIACVVV